MTGSKEEQNLCEHALLHLKKAVPHPQEEYFRSKGRSHWLSRVIAL